MLPLLFLERKNKNMMNESFPIEKVFPRLILFMLYVTTAHDAKDPSVLFGITATYLLMLIMIYHVPKILGRRMKDKKEGSNGRRRQSKKNNR